MVILGPSTDRLVPFHALPASPGSFATGFSEPSRACLSIALVHRAALHVASGLCVSWLPSRQWHLCDSYLSRIGECLELELVGMRILWCSFSWFFAFAYTSLYFRAAWWGLPIGAETLLCLGKKSQSRLKESSDHFKTMFNRQQPPLRFAHRSTTCSQESAA